VKKTNKDKETNNGFVVIFFFSFCDTQLSSFSDMLAATFASGVLEKVIHLHY
jgi:hypothetical protein